MTRIAKSTVMLPTMVTRANAVGAGEKVLYFKKVNMMGGDNGKENEQ